MSSYDLDFDADFDSALSRARCILYDVSDVPGLALAESALSESQPKAGVCPVQWGSDSIAFRCLDCEHDSSCVQCVGCFFKANHCGHEVRIIRTQGGTCDCGDPASWDPAGFCADHSETQPHLDGPQSMDLLPTSIRKRAHEILPILIEKVDALLSGDSCTASASASGGSEINEQAVRYARAARLLNELKSIGQVAFGLRYVVCENLPEARLAAWITWHGPGLVDVKSQEDAEKDEEETREVRIALHDFMLLYVQVSPSFKLRLSRVFADCYARIFPFHRSEVTGDICGLSVQLFTIPEVAVDLVTRRGLLERLSELQLSILETFMSNGKMSVAQKEREKVESACDRLRRLFFDAGFILGQPGVCSYVLSTPSVQAALLLPLRLMWRMNTQARRTKAHILYEETMEERFAFMLEHLVLQHLGLIGDYCRRPEATLEDLLPWYQTMAESLAMCHSFQESFNSSEEASFHLPLLRLFVRCMNFDLLADPGCAAEIAAALPPSCLASILRHAVGAVRFAAEVRDGRWVMNGDVMRVQEDKYQRQFRRLDVQALQMCVVLLGQKQVTSASPAASAPADPLEQLWFAVLGDELATASGTESAGSAAGTVAGSLAVAATMEQPGSSERPSESAVLARWLELLLLTSGHSSSAGQANADDLKRARPRIELFWEILTRVLNDLLLVEVAMCSGKRKAKRAERTQLILQRCLAQALAGRPLTLSELHSAVPSDLGAREAQIMEALEVVATRQEHQFVPNARSWCLYDFFLGYVVLQRDFRDRRGTEEAARAEEAALAQKEASLLGPRRADGVALASRLQDRLVESFGGSPLLDMVVAFVQHQCFARLAPRCTSQSRVAVQLQLDNAFVCCLKVLDVVCDVASLENCSALARQLCQPPGVRVRQPGQCVELSCGQFGTVGIPAKGDGGGANVEVYLNNVGDSGGVVASVMPSDLRPPACLSSRHSAILERLAVLHRLGSEHVVLSRLMSPHVVPRRLQERGPAIGLQVGGTSVGASAAVPGSDDAEARKRQRMETMKQRQKAMLLRMQQKQQVAAAELGAQAQDVDDIPIVEVAEAEERDPENDPEAWQCATCREAARPNDPLARVAEVAPSNVVKFNGGTKDITARFTSCSHLVHVGCCKTHVESVLNQARDGSLFFFVDPIRRGEFPCPMCRSLANCALPCLPIADVLEAVATDATTGDCETGTSRARGLAWCPSEAVARYARWRTRPTPVSLRVSLAATAAQALRTAREAARCSGGTARGRGKEGDSEGDQAGSTCMLRAAVTELNVASSLSALQLADCGAIPPLYATLLRGALCLRRAEVDALEPPQPAPTGAEQLAREFLQRDDLESIDVRFALADALLDACCSHGGLSQEGYAMMVLPLLQIRAKQILNGSAVTSGSSEVAADAANGGTTEREIAPRLVAFLSFAAWLCAAVWRLPPVDGKKLAFLDPADSMALPLTASLLRLPAAVATVADVLALAEQAVPRALAAGAAGPPDVDWLLPGRSALTNMTPLPEAFLDVIRCVYKKPCAVCGTEPAEPALCLLCGTLVCMNSHDCRGANRDEGQCTDHARRCGAGQCIFLLPYSALVLAVSAPICGFWDCPYVDHNGEPNPRLKRPCAMTFKLDERRFAALRRTCATASIHREIIQHNEKTGLHIPRPL